LCTAGILFSWGKHYAWVTALLNSKNIEELWGITVGGARCQKEVFLPPLPCLLLSPFCLPQGLIFLLSLSCLA